MRSTPWSRAKAVISVQKTIAASHWRSRSRTASSGQGYQTKLTVVDPGPSPGAPDMLTIFVPPGSSARRIVSRMIAACASPTTGWSGHAEQFRAASRSPRSSMASRQRSRASGSASSSSRRSGGGGGEGGVVGRLGGHTAPLVGVARRRLGRSGVGRQILALRGEVVGRARVADPQGAERDAGRGEVVEKAGGHPVGAQRAQGLVMLDRDEDGPAGGALEGRPDHRLGIGAGGPGEGGGGLGSR